LYGNTFSRGYEKAINKCGLEVFFCGNKFYVFSTVTSFVPGIAG